MAALHDQTPRDRDDVSVVIIGRNEGEQLEASVASAFAACSRVVYVDSGSTDGSVQVARRLGAEVVSLSDDLAMSAARGRNAGFDWVARHRPTPYVQFLDGDCILHPKWLEAGTSRLRTDPTVGVVAGRLSERRRERNVYHRLADMEWNEPPGEVEATGGNLLVRAEAWERAGGMNPAIAAGEELDFCLRVRKVGWKIVRLPELMASHEIDIDAFSGWWRRAERGGVAYAEGWWRRRRWRDARPVLSALFWGGLLPATSLMFAAPTRGLSLVLFAGYPHMWWRVRRHRRVRGDEDRDAEVYALFCVLAKGAELAGIARFARRLSGSAWRGWRAARGGFDE